MATKIYWGAQTYWAERATIAWPTLEPETGNAGGGNKLIAEIHVAPTPFGTEKSQYQHVEAALSAIAKSGLTYEVGAMGTTVQGPEDEVWATLRAAHEATINDGADRNFTNIRIFSTTETEPDMFDLTTDYR